MSIIKKLTPTIQGKNELDRNFYIWNRHFLFITRYHPSFIFYAHTNNNENIFHIFYADEE